MAVSVRWFIRAVTTQIVGHPDGREDGGEGFSVDSVKMANHRGSERPSSSGDSSGSEFRMPLHYPRYKKEDYMKMEEWKVDMLLREYGLPCRGSLEDKRAFAMGAFLWPSQI